MENQNIGAVAIIPARGGSKGIPRKNIINVAGKPLIAWTIEAAKKCPHIEHVVVTSDDDEILSVAKEYGAETLRRPLELASDTAIAKSVLSHALVEFRKIHGILPKHVVYLQPTSPLRTHEHLIAAFDLLLDNPDANALISVREIGNTVLKTYLVNEENYLIPASRPEFANANKQTLPKLFQPNGAIYIMNTSGLVENPRFDGECTLPFVMSEEDSVDVDSLEDLPPVEEILRKRIV